MLRPVVPNEIQATYRALSDKERVHDKWSGRIYSSPLAKSRMIPKLGSGGFKGEHNVEERTTLMTHWM